MRPAAAGAILAWAAAIAVALAAEAPPSPEEAARLREGAREVALSYAKTLPDFECTEVVRREMARAHGPRRLLDVLTIRLTYFGPRDHHELLQVNGQRADRQYTSLGGAIGEGEFGATLATIFKPEAGAEFDWRGWTTIQGRRAAVFGYQVDAAKARYAMLYQADGTGTLSAQVGFRGEVTIDRESFGVLRLTYEMRDVPRDFPIHSSSTRVEYGFAEIGGKRYLLPRRAETEMHTETTGTWNGAEFRGYRKFETDSKVTFGEEK